MFDEYTLHTDAPITDAICDGLDLDDVLHRFSYVDELYVNSIHINRIKFGLEDDNA